MKSLQFRSFLLLCFTMFFCVISTAQNDKLKIEKALTDYFFLERENIHVQFDKTTFMTSEEVWFKGYVFHRKKNVPFFSTINIFASLMDEKGTVIETKLLYGNIGSFSGSFKLKDTYKSGHYYLQFYTNWMNNFTEDESAVYHITIINSETGAGNILAKAPADSIKISLHPESGILLEDNNNVLGLKIADCNNEPLPVTFADIVDPSGNKIKTIPVNSLGYGRIEIPMGTPPGCKVTVTIDGKEYNEPLPEAKKTGFIISTNSYALTDKTLVTLKTTPLTLKGNGNQPLYLMVHQDDKAVIYDVDFANNTELKLLLPNTDLVEGLNTIRLLDSSMKQLAERLVYAYPAADMPHTEVKAEKQYSALTLNGKAGAPFMNLSISALPEDTRAYNEDNDIYSSFKILPYIEGHPKISGKYYFTTISKGKMFELDLFLLCQKDKYQWHDILNNPPKSNYTFDMGLTLQGSLPKQYSKIKSTKIRLYSLSSVLDESTDVDDKGEFTFDNLIIPDSSAVMFTLIIPGKKTEEISLKPKMPNVYRPYIKKYQPPVRCYTPIAEDQAQMPMVYKDQIQLEEVVVEGTPLKYAKAAANRNLTGYKITDREINSFNSILNFIKFRSSFQVNDNSVNVTIYSSRNVYSINAGRPTPIIYLDDMQLLDYDILRTIALTEVEEIYMNAHAIVPSVRNHMGIIRIYRNHDYKSNSKGSGLTEVIIEKGFSQTIPFANVNYSSTSDEGYSNFGVIDWEPEIMAQEDSSFETAIPITGQNEIKLIIEGFTADGKLLSEIKTIKL
ncbi:hypothetical protein [Flavobacterium rhizosphaerae]|uniref:TonB-dependent receptor plug domain-containing protein n=1 Tax=Flavobacterium rhizosphaerae TaxID=3163298 RepID=A0ABW8YWF6_9FLAO